MDSPACVQELYKCDGLLPALLAEWMETESLAEAQSRSYQCGRWNNFTGSSTKKISVVTGYKHRWQNQAWSNSQTVLQLAA